MAAQKSQADIFKELLGESLANRLSIAKEFEEFIPELVKAIKDKAVGICVEREVQTQKGETYTYYYVRSPDVQAAQLALKLANYEPKEHAETLLAMSRGRQADSEIANASAKKKALLAQAESMNKATQLAEMALITEEAHTEACEAISQGGLGLLTRCTQEELREAGSSEEAYQKWQMKMATRFSKLYASAMSGQEQEQEDE